MYVDTQYYVMLIGRYSYLYVRTETDSKRWRQTIQVITYSYLIREAVAIERE